MFLQYLHSVRVTKSLQQTMRLIDGQVMCIESNGGRSVEAIVMRVVMYKFKCMRA